jgi:putative Holliday junction resolvase
VRPRRPRKDSPSGSRDAPDSPVDTYDERLTTALSERRLREIGVRTGHERARVDQGAAIALLESYLRHLEARSRDAPGTDH